MVLDRIEAFRRRRPRLTDEVITLAHGAGGKASAALVDSVFLDAFARRGHRSARRRGHPAVALGRAPGVHDGLVCGAAVALSGRLDRAPRRQRHGQRPRRVRGAAGVAGRRVRHRGGVPDRRTARDRRGHGGGRRCRRRQHRHRRHEGGGRGRGRSGVHHDGGRRDIPAGRLLGPEQVRPATWCWCRARSPTTAWP